MSNTPNWDEVRRIRDEIQLKMHLAGMDARDRWNALQPRFVALETRGRRAGHVLADRLTVIGTALRELRDEIADELDPERPL